VKQIFPSTHGNLYVRLHRRSETTHWQHNDVRFSSIRTRVNTMLMGCGTEDDPVNTIEISFTTTADKASRKREK